MNESYIIENNSILYSHKGDFIRLCSDFDVVGYSIDSDGLYHHVLHYKDNYFIIAYSEVGTNDGWRKLRNFLDIPSQRRKLDLLTEYIQLSQSDVKWEMPDNAGWYNDDYILPTGEIIGNSQNILFNGKIANDKKIAFGSKGSLEEWQQHIGEYATGNSRFCLLLGAAFAAPLLKWINIEGGILHLYGQSTAGKTTLQQVAQSVWGHGINASEDWDATAYALTNVAQALNDGLLSLDEISKDYDGNGVKKGIYALANGKGRTRGNQTIGNRPTARFRVLGISTGETNLETHLKKHGHEIMAGELVRCPSIPQKLENHHHFKNFKCFAEHLNKAIQCYYGTAGRAYIKFLTSDLSIKNRVIEYYQSIYSHIQNTYPLTDQTSRTARLFVATAVGIQLACEANILHLDSAKAIQNIEQCFIDWLKEQPNRNSYEEDKIINQAIDFMQTNDVNFMNPDNPTGFIRECPGYVKRYLQDKSKEVEYYVFPKIFKEKICNGFDEKKVKEVLSKNGWLVKPEENRWLIQLQGLDSYTGKRTRLGRFYKFIGIEPSFLENEM